MTSHFNKSADARAQELPLRPRWDRRDALKLLASGMALALGSCGKPNEEIVPYVDMPERLIPGEPLRFATTLPLSGYGRGVLAVTVDGRPIKIEGNPRHPASLGATDVFAESAVLSLYDPDRSKAVRGPMGLTSWQAFGGALHDQLARESASGGSGLRVLSGRVTSPTLSFQLNALLQKFPQARLHRHEAIDDGAARAGATQAFGRALIPRPRLADAVVILALDADPIGPGPDQMQLARGFAARRQPALDAGDFLRLYVVESGLSMTGANADERLALAPGHIRNFALAVATVMGAAVTAGDLPDGVTAFAQRVATDLTSHIGKALVIPGPGQHPDIHALCHWMNQKISAPVDFIEPIDASSGSPAGTLAELSDDCAAGKVHTLLIVDANPVYAAPAALQFNNAVRKVDFSVHLGFYEDETAAMCQWHLPLSHSLESWSDLRATDGTASIVQPAIRPLYDSRTAHEVIALFTGEQSVSPYDLVRDTWRSKAGGGGDFEAWWRKALHDGVIADSAAPHVNPGPVAAPNAPPFSGSDRLVLTLAPDPTVWDGSFANNAWLQECPKPVTKQVWGNGLHISPADAARLGIADGEIARLQVNDAAIEIPVVIEPLHADGVVSTTLGYGRQTGAIAKSIGVDVHALMPRDGTWTIENIALKGTGRQQPILTTQRHFRLEGETKDLLRSLTIAELRQHPAAIRPVHADQATLLPPHSYDSYAWAMVIDNSLCIGCNACVVACQAENNVPVIGPEEISAGRDMHWLRIDAYRDEPGSHFAGFEPVPCMHCEHAPCEPVCPVAASVHDSEGLNVQVYNRCIGTRFCQSNCPYKVRRFNFFGYADGQEYANLGAESLKAQKNPEVTVRARGVMEKCTYCVQRISHARRAAEKEDRPIRDGEVVTACQAACPTRAISFGDRNRPESTVSKQRALPHHYELLGHLGTRPRTTYLARLRNPVRPPKDDSL